MLRTIAPIFGVLAVVYPLRAQTQVQEQRIRVNVDLVSVNVRVTDKQNRDVSGLSPEDFDLMEDGRKQKVAFFDTEKEPITLSILVDSSSSMNVEDKLGAAQRMLEELIMRSRLEDEVSLMEFTDHIVSFKPITREHRLLALAAGTTLESGGTALYDAVASAFCHLGSARNLRQAIVVFTDGADQHSRIKLEQLIRLVHRSRPQLFIIGFYRGPEYAVYKESDKTVTLVTGREIDNPLVVFDRLARESGAEAFFPTTKERLEQAVNEISNILRAQYTLAYYPQGSQKSIRRIQVKVHRGGIKVRAREAVGSLQGEEEGIQFAPDTCQVSPRAHPFPYESRLMQSGVALSYREDFADARTGWPNREGSRYTPKGYELSFAPPKEKDGRLLIVANPVGIGALAAYGPWWEDFRASVSVDAGWAKVHAPVRTFSLKSQSVLNDSSAGIIFRLRDSGYYAFLLSTSTQAYKAGEMSFKLVKKTFFSISEEVIIPWTRLAARQIQKGIASGIKLTVECKGDEITLFVDDSQVGQVRDNTLDSGNIGFVSLGTGRVWFRDLLVEGTQ